MEIEQGDVVGIIGSNGAGKSTLLKVISRVTGPTRGEIKIKGRVASLLEVGTGFHPELTGRENIYLNGAIMGMKVSEINRRFDEIVDFSGVEKFIDTPVKRYSSGMFVRLAFAVAAHLDPEILLVDEVLAVGDAEFQKKCLGKMRDQATGGRTVLFVSHNMAAISQLCAKGILVSDGAIAYQGPIEEVVQTYMDKVTEDLEQEVVFPDRPGVPASFTRLCLLDEEGRKTAKFANSSNVTLEIEFMVREKLVKDHIFVLLDRSDGLLVTKVSDDDFGHSPPEIRYPGRYVSQVRFPGGILNEGAYRFRVVIGKRRAVQYDSQACGFFQIEDTTDYRESCFGKRNGAIMVPVEWRHLSGPTDS